MSLNKPNTLRNNAFSESFLKRFRKQRLNEVSSTHLLDDVGDYHGTQYEKSVYALNGIYGYVNTEMIAPSLNGEIVIDAKITGEGCLMSNRHSGSNYFEIDGSNIGQPLVSIAMKEGSDNYTLDSDFINDGNWHNIKIRYTGTELHIYIDNVLDASLTGMNQITSNDNEVTIGQRGNGSHFITALMANFVWKDLNDVVLIQYNMEERVGTTAFDCSGNGNDGSLVGGVTHTEVRVNGLKNYTNEVGYTNNAGVIVPRVNNALLDAQGNPLQFVGKVATDMKLVQSNCIQLDGVNGYGRTYATDYALGTSNFVLESWVQFAPTTSAYSGIIGADDNLVVFTWVLRLNGNGRLQLYSSGIMDYFSQSNTGTFGTDIRDGLIHRVKVERIGNTMSFYIDEVLDYSVNCANFNGGSRPYYLFVGVGNIIGGVPVYLTKGLVFGLNVNGVRFPIAEGAGTTSYAYNDETKTITWYGGATWSTQDVYHHNINGFTKGVNKIDYSEDFNQWGTNYAPKSEFLTSGFTDPFGGNKAFRINNSLGQIFTLQRPIANVANHTISMWIKTNDGSTINRSLLYGNNVTNNKILNVTPEWKRFSFTTTGTGFGNTWGIYSITGEVDILIAFAQMEKGEMTDYQRTTGSPTAGANLPYKINGVYTNPDIVGHNGAETELTMEVFREDLADSDYHYDQTDLSSQVRDYNDINLSSKLAYIKNKVCKTDIKTFLPFYNFFKFKSKNNGFRENSIRQY